MLQLLLTLALAAPVGRAVAMPLSHRLSLRNCQDALNPLDEWSLGHWLSQRADERLDVVDYFHVSHFRKLPAEIAGRRAFTVDWVLEILSEQPPYVVNDHEVRRATWQMRAFGDSTVIPDGLFMMVLGDRLSWDKTRQVPETGEFLIMLHWEDKLSPALIDRLPDLVNAAHASGPAAAAALRLVRAGDPLDGELYVLLDVDGDAAARFAVTLELFKVIQDELVKLNTPARRP